MILGAVLAGGQSTRFGSDKALAELDGSTLLTRAVDLLAGWCEHVVVVGREDARTVQVGQAIEAGGGGGPRRCARPAAAGLAARRYGAAWGYRRGAPPCPRRRL